MFILYIVLACITVILLRLSYVYSTLNKKSLLHKKSIKVLAVAGSGGHTSELLRTLEALSHAEFYKPRFYVVANTDVMSVQKIKEFEKSKNAEIEKDYFITQIPRSREVAQSWTSTLWTTLLSFVYSFPVVFQCKPDLVLCNGPGTCIPICISALILKVLGLGWSDLVYIESLCRVTTMSMSGRILYPFCNKFFIQWPYLLKEYPKAIYLGRIV